MEVIIMTHEDFTIRHRLFARISCWGGLIVGLVYTVFAVLAIIYDPPTAKMVKDPFNNPFSPIASIILLPTATFLIACIASIYAYAPRGSKVYGMLSLVFMSLAMGITTVINFSFFVTLTHHDQMVGTIWLSLIFPSTQPRMLGQVDYLAWGWFFGLSMIMAAPIFSEEGLEKAIRILMTATGILTIVGWGIMIFFPPARLPALIMQALGWGVLVLIVIFLLARLFDRMKPVDERR
jgi:hypothetical protein